MGVGIDVSTGQIVKEPNGKYIGVLADTLVGKAAAHPHEFGEPRMWANFSITERDKASEYMGKYLDIIQADLDERKKSNPAAYDEKGNIRIEMTIWAGNRDNHKDVYTEVTKDGFYLYPSAESMDEHNRNAAYFTDNAQDAADIHMTTAMAAADRRDARKSFVNSYCEEERLERDRIKRQLKKASNKLIMKKNLNIELREAQAALDYKKARAYETPEYKALLVPGKNESITTMFDIKDDFADAVASIPVSENQLEQ